MAIYNINSSPFILWGGYKKEGSIKQKQQGKYEFTTDKGTYQVVSVSTLKFLLLKYLIPIILVLLYYVTSIKDVGVNAVESIVSLYFLWLCVLTYRSKGPTVTMICVAFSYVGAIASLFFVHNPGLVKYHLSYFTINLIFLGLISIILRDIYFRNIQAYAIKDRIGTFVHSFTPKANKKALIILLVLSVLSMISNGYLSFYHFKKQEIERAAYLKQRQAAAKEAQAQHDKVFKNGGMLMGTTKIKVYPYMEFECKSNLQTKPKIVAPFQNMKKEFIDLPVEEWLQDDHTMQYYFKIARDKSAKEIFTCRIDTGWFAEEAFNKKPYHEVLKAQRDLEKTLPSLPIKPAQGGAKWIY